MRGVESVAKNRSRVEHDDVASDEENFKNDFVVLGYRIRLCRPKARPATTRATAMSTSRVLKNFRWTWTSFIDQSYQWAAQRFGGRVSGMAHGEKVLHSSDCSKTANTVHAVLLPADARATF